MSDDTSRLTELQTAMRTKMDQNKDIADSFEITDGVVQVDTDQKSAFDKNMKDIKEIKGLIDGIQELEKAREWGSQPSQESVAAEAAAEGGSAAPTFQPSMHPAGGPGLASQGPPRVGRYNCAECQRWRNNRRYLYGRVRRPATGVGYSKRYG